MEVVYYPYPKAPFLKPEDVIAELELKAGEKVLDFGAGAGFWAIPIAQIVGPNGHVYVTDAKAENLSVIKSKAVRARLDNLSYFIAPYSAKLMPIQTKVDLILCSNVISLADSVEQIIEQAKKLAKGDTRLVIIDWNQKSPAGPKKENRLNMEEVITVAGKAGFEFKKLLSAGAHHTGMYFVYNK